MFRFYLTPASISYLSQVILALSITIYFAYRAWAARNTREPHALLLLGFFASIALFSLLLFVEVSLQRGSDLYAIYLENTVLGIGLMLLLQFAYRFPKLYPQRRIESLLVLVLSLAYILWEFITAVNRFQHLIGQGEVLWRPYAADYALTALLLWVPVVLLRQSITASQPTGKVSLKSLHCLLHPHGKSSQAARDLAIVYFIPFILSLINIFTTYKLLPRAGFFISLSWGISIALTGFAIIYLDQLAETTSFIIKLLGITLMTTLAILGMAGWAIVPAYAQVYHPHLPEHRTLRFTPNAQGGYDVHEVPFYFEDATGDPLFEDESFNPMAMPVEFTFPFYGKVYDRVYLSTYGAIVVGKEAFFADLNYRYGGPVPAIFPLLIDLNTDNLLVNRQPDRLVVTWYQKPATNFPDQVFTFQAVLYTDGTFDLTYGDLPDHLTYLPNNDPAASPWVIGATPGQLTQEVQRVDFNRLPVSGDSRGIVQDYQLDFRQHLHQMLLPLAYMIFISSVMFIIGFPILLRSTLVRPLNALLAGVQAMNQGDYSREVPVKFPDEIGFLTRSFNAMARELGVLIGDLEQKVEERVAEIKRINKELEISREQIAILHDIDKAILGAESPQSIAQSILGRLSKIIPCKRVSVLEFDEHAVCVLAVEAAPGFDLSLGWLNEMYGSTHRHLTLRAVDNIRTIAQTSVLQDAMLSQNISAYMIVPLVAQGQIIGVMVIESDQPNAFNTEHQALATQVSGMLALALAQARLRIALQKHVEELRAQNAELDAFAHTVAHDLRNPLSIVMGFTDILLENKRLCEDADAFQAVSLIEARAKNMADIIQALLLLASVRQEEVELTPLDMGSIVDDVLLHLSYTLEKAQAQVIYPSEWPQALGYRSWIVEVWTNYITNALKYGGTPPRIELGSDVLPDGRVRFWVRDNGPGISPEKMTQLFTPFTRLDRSKDGHGLGLSIVRRIMDRLGGDVFVESTIGEGSTFGFILPGV